MPGGGHLPPEEDILTWRKSSSPGGGPLPTEEDIFTWRKSSLPGGGPLPPEEDILTWRRISSPGGGYPRPGEDIIQCCSMLFIGLSSAELENCQENFVATINGVMVRSGGKKRRQAGAEL